MNPIYPNGGKMNDQIPKTPDCKPPRPYKPFVLGEKRDPTNEEMRNLGYEKKKNEHQQQETAKQLLVDAKHLSKVSISCPCGTKMVVNGDSETVCYAITSFFKDHTCSVEEVEDEPPEPEVLKTIAKNCPYTLGDSNCTYFGSADYCDKTYQRCTELNNGWYFGGVVDWSDPELTKFVKECIEKDTDQEVFDEMHTQIIGKEPDPNGGFNYEPLIDGPLKTKWIAPLPEIAPEPCETELTEDDPLSIKWGGPLPTKEKKMDEYWEADAKEHIVPLEDTNVVVNTYNDCDSCFYKLSYHQYPNTTGDEKTWGKAEGGIIDKETILGANWMMSEDTEVNKEV